MIEIIPAIDIISGKCVRLSEGDYNRGKVYDSPPLDMALRYADCGVRRIHMVDLDGAKVSSPANLRTLEAVASKVDCEIEWGGGIAGEEDIASVFSAGATQAIIGSVAVRRQDLFSGWLGRFGGGKVILGADARDGRIAVKGWQESVDLSIDDLVDRFLPDGLAQVICTDISRDGMLQGPSDALYVRLQGKYPQTCFTVSGGIGSFADIERLDALGLRKVIVGKAIYENRITLKQIKEWSQNA